MCNGTFRSWMETQYSPETMKDIYHHGCGGGVSGLIYYSETTALYAAYQEEIWEILQESAEEFGYENVIELLASNSKANLSTPATFANHLVLFAAEAIASQWMQKREQEEEEIEEVFSFKH